MPEIEEREAAVFAGYTWPHWSELTLRERIDVLAHFRIHRLIEQHSEDAVSAALERRTKKAHG